MSPLAEAAELVAHRFAATCGSTQGRAHARLGRNNQDGVAVHTSQTLIVAAITDGCGGSKSSEVGARLGAAWLAARVPELVRQRGVTTALARVVTDGLVGFLHEQARALTASGAALAATIDTYFLFSFLCAVVDADTVLVFGVGDGVVSHNGVVTVLDAGPENAPEYLAYRLLGPRPADALAVHHLGPSAALSVLRSDVQYPRAGVHFRVLPDELLHWFEAMFEKDRRDELPERLLRLTWTKCRCGAEHARPTCPDCASLGAAAMRAATRHNGRCTATVVFRTHGQVLAAVQQEGLKYLYAADGAVRREDGQVVWSAPLQPGLRFSIAGPVTYAGVNGQVRRINAGMPVALSSTGMTGTDTVFAAAAGRLLRTEGEWLIDGVTGNRVGKIMEGQTWLRSGEALAFGFYRAGLVPFFFLLRHGRTGLVEVKLPAIEGRMVECSAVFDEQHVLFSCLHEKDGKRTGAMFLVGSDGALIAHAAGPAEDSRMFTSTRGRALLGGRMVCATDEGLLALAVSGGRIIEGTLFTDTQPFVGAGWELIPGAGGSVYVISTQEIVQLQLA